jgi:epoxyqueuosine reductase
VSERDATLHREAVLERARMLGFEHVGIARADAPIEQDFERFRAFVAAGMHGDMTYLAEDPEARRRLDGESVLPGARSVVCLARPYGRAAGDEATDPPLAQGIARYARGQDYHNHLRKKLRLLAKFIRTLSPDVRARPLCDVEPVLERAWAARAGLGFVGKNGLVIVPGRGSYVLLGEVVTTLPLAPDEPMTERCGSCTRCLDACPTSAFAAPFVLDPRRCIAYLTIESPRVPELDLRERIGDHLFGCDDCQSVCPYNRTSPPPASATRAYAPLPVWSRTELTDWVAADDDRFSELTQGSPTDRATRRGFARNALVVAANRLRRGPSPESERALEVGRTSPDPFVAELAVEEVERARRR